MANTSVKLIGIEGHMAPGKSGDTWTALGNAGLPATAGGLHIGALFRGTDGAVYKLVQSLNATAPADGDLCVPDKDGAGDAWYDSVDDAAAGDVGEAPVGVYVSTPAQNSYCFVAVKGEIQTKFNGASNSIAVGDMLVLGAANDLTLKLTATPYTAAHGRMVVAYAREASTADEGGLKKAVLLGIGW